MLSDVVKWRESVITWFDLLADRKEQHGRRQKEQKREVEEI